MMRQLAAPPSTAAAHTSQAASPRYARLTAFHLPCGEAPCRFGAGGSTGHGCGATAAASLGAVTAAAAAAPSPGSGSCAVAAHLQRCVPTRPVAVVPALLGAWGSCRAVQGNMQHH